MMLRSSPLKQPDSTAHQSYKLKQKIYQFWVPFLFRFGGIFVICTLLALSEKWTVFEGFVLALLVSLLLQTWQLFRITEWIDKTSDPAHSFDKSPRTLVLFKPLLKTIRKARRAEEKTRKELSKVLDTFQGLMQTLPFGVILLDHELGIQWANTKAEHHFKIDTQKDLGLSILNLARDPTLYELLEEKQTNHIEWIPRHLSYVRLHLTRISFGTEGFLLLSEDVSQQFQIEEARKQFMAHASHELQTPLAILRGYTELLENEHPDNPNMPKLLQQVDRMSAIIRDLLQLSQLEQGRSLHFHVEQLHVLCHKTFETLSQTSPKPLRFVINTHPLQARCIASEIISVIQNLVSNAIRFTPENGAIQLHLFQENQSAVIEISDTGMGIDQSHIEHLGTRFYRINRSFSANEAVPEGTGLGLAIVKQIANRHHGFLKIHSELNKGSTFSFYLPLSISNTPLNHQPV